MNSLLIDLGLSLFGSLGIGICVSIFAKVFPKDDIYRSITKPSAEYCAMFIHALCKNRLKLKPKQEADIEEGIFKTIAYQLDGWIHTFIAKWNELIAFRQDKK